MAYLVKGCLNCGRLKVRPNPHNKTRTSVKVRTAVHRQVHNLWA